MKVQLNHYLKLFYHKYPFPPLVWYIIVETALARGSFYLVMPFIAIRMSEQTNASFSLIGMILGLGPLCGTLLGFYIGHLSDHWGRRKIIMSALFLWSFVFLGFIFAVHSFAFAILMMLNGVARAGFEPVSAALVSDLCNDLDPSGELQEKAFHLRYFAINLGAAIAPMIGVILVLSHSYIGFAITASVYFLSALCFKYFSKKFGIKAYERLKHKSNISFFKVLQLVKNDYKLLFYLLAFFCTGLAFSQVDAIMPLYLKNLFSHDGIILFARLLALNGFIVVILTLPLLKYTKNFNLNLLCAMSCLLWSLGYFIAACSVVPWHFYVSMVLMSISEIIVFANGNLLIESLAPSNMKGAYLGSTSLATAGFILGPWWGGTLLKIGGGALMFSVMGILMIVAALIYLNIRKNATKLLMN